MRGDYSLTRGAVIGSNVRGQRSTAWKSNPLVGDLRGFERAIVLLRLEYQCESENHHAGVTPAHRMFAMDQRTVILICDTATSVAVFERRQREWHRAALMECPHGYAHMPREPSDLVPLGQQLGKWLHETIPDGAISRLVIPASWCFIQTVPSAIAKNREQAAIFEFEQFLPTDLDSLTCAVQVIDNDFALVAGVETVPMLGLLNQLESHHICVEAIFVDALLTHEPDVGDFDCTHAAVLVRGTHHCSLAAFRQGVKAPIHVRSALLHSDESAFEAVSAHSIITTLPVPLQRLRVLQLGDCDGDTEPSPAGTSALLDIQTTSRDESVGSLLGAAVKGDSAMDLRKDDLAFAGRWASVTKQFSRVCFALVALILVFGLRFRMANAELANGLADLRPQREAIYSQAYPGKPAPPEAALRIRSERFKLQSLTEQKGLDDALPSTNGLDLFERMHDILEHIPPDLKLAISEVHLDERGIRLAGRTTSHGRAGEIVQALNQLPDISAEPPHTNLRKDQTVTFRINARVAQEESGD